MTGLNKLSVLITFPFLAHYLSVEDDKNADTSQIWNNYNNFYDKTLQKYKKQIYKDKNEVVVQYYFDTFGLDLNENEIQLKGKWVNIIINAKWADEGFLHLWIDGKLVSSYYGNTLAGTEKIRLKFGPYRNYMDDATSQNIKIPDLNIKYANVGKS